MISTSLTTDRQTNGLVLLSTEFRVPCRKGRHYAILATAEHRHHWESKQNPVSVTSSSSTVDSCTTEWKQWLWALPMHAQEKQYTFSWNAKINQYRLDIHSNMSTEEALVPQRCHRVRQYVLRSAYNSLSNTMFWWGESGALLTRNVFPQCPHTTLVPSGWTGKAGWAGCSSGISITGPRVMMRLLC